MHLSLLNLLLLTTSTFAAPIPTVSDAALSKRSGPNFGGNCWVLRKSDGSTSYSNSYLGPNSHFQIGCIKAERESRRKEGEERKKRLEEEIKTIELNEDQRACFATLSAPTADSAGSSSQMFLGREESVKTDAGQMIGDRLLLAECRKSIRKCNESRAMDKRAGWGVGTSTKSTCKGEIGRLAEVEVCLRKVGGYPGPYA